MPTGRGHCPVGGRDEKRMSVDGPGRLSCDMTMRSPVAVDRAVCHGIGGDLASSTDGAAVGSGHDRGPVVEEMIEGRINTRVAAESACQEQSADRV